MEGKCPGTHSDAANTWEAEATPPPAPAAATPLYNRISLIPQTSTTKPPHVGIWGSSWNQMIPPQIPPVSEIWWNQMTPPPDPTRSHHIPPYPTISHQHHAP
jgi:hypothetical protein